MNYAILGNEKNFTVFKYGNHIIRFKVFVISQNVHDMISLVSKD